MFPDLVSFKISTVYKAAVSPPGALLIGAAAVLVFRQWPTDTAAAWVQAIGSIGAILGAFAVANRTHKIEREAERQKQLEQECSAAYIAETIAWQFGEVAKGFYGAALEYESVHSHLRNLETIRSDFSTFISVSTPLQVIREVLQLKGYLDKFCTSFELSLRFKSGVLWSDIQDFSGYRKKIEQHRRNIENIACGLAADAGLEQTRR